MADRLLVAVLGNRNSGKTTTWAQLFGAGVKTGKHPRQLNLNAAQFVEVFLISGSPQERDKEVEKVLPASLPRIVLCSTQYRSDVTSTYDYFFRNGYEVFVQWLNPGYGDLQAYQDSLGLRDYLLSKGATLQIRNGKVPPTSRVRELRQVILGWATHRDLVRTDWPA